MACADGLSAANANDDGRMTHDEAMAANFSLLDGDADGVVTEKEFAACRTGVTLEEYLAFGMVRYERAAEEALSDPDVGIPVKVLTRVR
ncbi:MAG: hypothetical protein GDA49_11560 [Rhodospirillales bacterium]|nr:hypothetical protein [Rhodospirillales bacterium]